MKYGLYPSTDTQRNKLHFGDVGFHCSLYKEMPRQAVTQHNLCI